MYIKRKFLFNLMMTEISSVVNVSPYRRKKTSNDFAIAKVKYTRSWMVKKLIKEHVIFYFFSPSTFLLPHIYWILFSVLKNILRMIRLGTCDQFQ